MFQILLLKKTAELMMLEKVKWICGFHSRCQKLESVVFIWTLRKSDIISESTHFHEPIRELRSQGNQLIWNIRKERHLLSRGEHGKKSEPPDN